MKSTGLLVVGTLFAAVWIALAAGTLYGFTKFPFEAPRTLAPAAAPAAPLLANGK